jgi:arylsulfatase A-like enzyme
VTTAPALVGGYVKNLDGTFTPSNGLQATLDHTDQSIGLMVAALDQQGLLDSTVIIVTAKHGNSPIDPSTLVRIDPTKVDPLTPGPDSIADIIQNVQAGLLAQLSADTGPLIWLKDSSRTEDVVAALKAADPAITGIDPNAPGQGVLWGDDLAALYADPRSDSRVPDIILFPVAGTVYTTSKTKIADHGGFHEDDVHVALLVSSGLGGPKTIDDPVETRQIACTILKALNMDCDGLLSQQIEPSKFLPNSNHY